MAQEVTAIERYSGSLVGLAVGDALGTTLEFSAPGTFALIDDIVGGGPWDLAPGQWTDDTSMALCLAESLCEMQGFNPKDQMDRYVKWYREGYMSSTGQCFDIGGTVSEALERYEATGKPFSGSTDPLAAGNGSLMRLAPIALHFAGNDEEVDAFCAKSSRTTHGALECIDACRYFGALLTGAIRGESKEQLLQPFFHSQQGWWENKPLTARVATIAAGSYKEKEPPLIKGGGYVVDSLEAALWAFYKSNSFEDGVLKAVNLGEDADTTGAVYGQLAGAYYGIKNIPRRWRESISSLALLEKLALALYEQPHSVRSWEKKRPPRVLYERVITGEEQKFSLCLRKIDSYYHDFHFEIRDLSGEVLKQKYFKIAYADFYHVQCFLKGLAEKYPELGKTVEEMREALERE